jgi:hypothetical protein
MCRAERVEMLANRPVFGEELTGMPAEHVGGRRDDEGDLDDENEHEHHARERDTGQQRTK